MLKHDKNRIIQSEPKESQFPDQNIKKIAPTSTVNPEDNSPKNETANGFEDNIQKLKNDEKC